MAVSSQKIGEQLEADIIGNKKFNYNMAKKYSGHDSATAHFARNKERKITVDPEEVNVKNIMPKYTTGT